MGNTLWTTNHFAQNFHACSKPIMKALFLVPLFLNLFKYFPTRQSLQRALQNHYSNTPKSYEYDLQRRIENPAKHKERFVKIVKA